MFRIRPDPENPERVLLSMDNVPVGRFESADEAARAVYAQETGWDRWDLLREVKGFRDLSEWLEV